VSWWSDVVERARALFFRREREEWLEEEMSFHLQMQMAQNLKRGMSAEEARRAAQHTFGSVDRFAEEVRDARGVRPLEDFAQDVRYALRTLKRNPAFTASAIFVLGLGIGANTAIFSAVNAVVLRALPVHEPDRLYAITEENPEKGWVHAVAAPANYLDWKEQVAAFNGYVAAYTVRARTAVGGSVLNLGDGTPQLIQASYVTGNFFDVLGVRPLLGRTLTPDETWSGGENVAVLSHGAWQRLFAGDADIVGKVVQVNRQATRIVGVMPASFTFPRADIELWRPIGWDRADRTAISFRRAHWINVIARVRVGVTPEVANQQLQAVVERLKKQYPETNRVMGASMMPIQDKLVGDSKTPLLVLFGAVGVLLLIACANVGNLLLVKAAGRQRELAVRAALGARRLRIVRQLLTESLVLSALGGLAGLAIGWSGTRLLEKIQPLGLLPVEHFPLDVRVIVYSLAIALASGLVFGVAPAFSLARSGSGAALREGGRSGGVGRKARRAASVLVVAEVALAVLLVTGAGLLVKSFWKLQNADPGFDGTGVFALSLGLPVSTYDSEEKGVRFYESLLDKVRALPGVRAAAAGTNLPLDGPGWTSDFAIAGRGREEYGVETTHGVITPGYFRALGMALLLRGRDFAASDRADSERCDHQRRTGAETFRGKGPGRSANHVRALPGFHGDLVHDRGCGAWRAADRA
jgi:putative ABC transport system permease protein